MNLFRIERERWVSTKEEGKSGIMHGYDETYYEGVEADYYGVNDHGDAMFYVNTPTNFGAGYTTRPIASYAVGEWRTIKDVTNESIRD